MANRIKVDSESLARWSSKLTEVSEALEEAADALGRVDTDDDWWRKVRVRESFRLRDEGGSVSLSSARSAVSQLERTLERYQQRVNKLSISVKRAGIDFANAESDVKNLINGVGGAVNMQIYAGATAEGKSIISKWKDAIANFNWLDGIADFFGSAGMFLEANAGYATWLDHIKKISRAVPSMADKGNLWGFLSRDVYKFYGQTVSQHSNLGSRFYNNFHKVPSLKDNFAQGAKSAVAWVGLGLSAIGNSISNFSEYQKGEIGGVRAVFETIGETAVDVGAGWAIGAGVAAGIATVCGGAPVIAVAAGTIAVSAGLDWVTEKLTGKDFSEFTSDLVLDAGEAVIAGGKKVVSAAGDYIKNGWNNLTGGINAAFGW